MSFAPAKTIAAALVIGAAALTSTTSIAANEPRQVDVFIGGQEGYHTYRIPGLLRTQDGTLLAFCEGRKTGDGDHGDVDLVLKRSEDHGHSWGDLSLVHEEGGDAEIAIGNPCPVQDESTGTIWLPFCRDNNSVLMMHSNDDGRTWAKPGDITKQVKRPGWGWYATGPGVGIQLHHGGPHAGRLVIPCDHREPINGKQVMMSHCFYSDDNGASWQLGESVSPHTDECQVVELTDGRLLINMRNYWARSGGEPKKGGMRAIAYSSDGGASWSELKFDRALIEPVCQASLVAGTVREGASQAPLFFSNPASKTKRHRMTIRLSRDGGKTWPLARMLHEGSSGYSSLSVLSDHQIGCLYERDDYRRITFAAVDVAWLTATGSR